MVLKSLLKASFFVTINLNNFPEHRHSVHSQRIPLDLFYISSISMIVFSCVHRDSNIHYRERNTGRKTPDNRILMKNSIIKSITALLICFIVISTSILYPLPEVVKAKTKGITVKCFISLLAEELELSPVTDDKETGLTSVDGDTEQSCIDILLEIGIIHEGDFTSYEGNLTRGNAMVLLNRADEYLYGDNLSPKLVRLAIEHRISDIAEVVENKQEDVAKAYLKGYVKGFSNGDYSTDRCMKVNADITKEGALNCLKMLRDKSLRALLSPDGQLLRTDKLPKYSKYYPYILASFPNSYYDWKFMYEDAHRYEGSTRKEIPYINLIDYAAPVDIDKTTDFENMKAVREEYLDVWVGKVRTYMEKVFSADYRTIDDKWVEEVLKTDFGYNNRAEAFHRNEINDYVNKMKKNKTIVEYKKIAVDGSTLYYFDGSYYLRTFVNFRIVSSNIKFGIEDEMLVNDWTYNNILYSRRIVQFTEYSIGVWRKGYYDVELGWLEKKQGSAIGIHIAYLNDFYSKRSIN